jgi:hypothetical protein
VGASPHVSLDRLLAVRDGCDNLDLRRLLKQQRQSLTHELVIFCDQDADLKDGRMILPRGLLLAHALEGLRTCEVVLLPRAGGAPIVAES